MYQSLGGQKPKRVWHFLALRLSGCHAKNGIVKIIFVKAENDRIIFTKNLNETAWEALKENGVWDVVWHQIFELRIFQELEEIKHDCRSIYQLGIYEKVNWKLAEMLSICQWWLRIGDWIVR